MLSLDGRACRFPGVSLAPACKPGRRPESSIQQRSRWLDDFGAQPRHLGLAEPDRRATGDGGACIKPLLIQAAWAAIGVPGRLVFDAVLCAKRRECQGLRWWLSIGRLRWRTPVGC